MSAAATSEVWGIGRWVIVIGGLALLAGSSAQFLTRWPQLPPAAEIAHPDYLFDPRADGTSTTDELLPDPTAFAAPDPRGFSGAADRLRIDDRLLVDGVGGRRLGGVGLDAVAVAALRQLDELDRRGRDIEPDDGSRPALKKHG